ncbi:MAG: hypothetical protein WCO56_14540 [Verrucomicrobiota bacterium]
MKIFLKTSGTEQGSVLMLTMLCFGILGFTLASYLTLVSTQSRAVERSQTWNTVMPLVEAGLEEAMAHLNQTGTTNLYSDGWQKLHIWGWYAIPNLAMMQRTMDKGRYVVSITAATQPTIECTGYVPAPFVTLASISPLLGSLGPTYARPGEVYRSVRVTTGGGSFFAMGMIAKNGVDMHGNNVASDSFDSGDQNFSTNGKYDPAKHKDNGDIATNSGQPGLFNAGNANICGHVFTGPGGTINIGPNGVVGSLAWFAGGNAGIEPGHFSDDMNMSFPTVVAPFTGGYTPGGGNISITNFVYGSNWVTTAAYPSPPPGGAITTNTTGMITTYDYPTGYVLGAVVTNVVTVTSTDYPTNAFGAITTNIFQVNSNTLPTPVPAGVIKTNVTWFTNVALPTPLPNGTIQTNTVFSSVQYPSTPMPPGPPSNAPAWTPPSAGTYVGVLTNRYNSVSHQSDRGWWHDYQAIRDYTYNQKDYTWNLPTTYTCQMRRYSYTVLISYTYFARTSTNVTVTTSAYDLILDSYNYAVDSLGGTVYVRGNTSIYVRNSISFSGLEGITIGPNGSLKLYMAGASASISGQGLLNPSGQAIRFQYFGLDTHTDLKISGNGTFCGAIYAPNAAFTLGGGGNNTQDFCGAAIVNTVSMVGHFNFHYDEDLLRSGPGTRFIVTSWNEVAPNDTTVIKWSAP